MPSKLHRRPRAPISTRAGRTEFLKINAAVGGWRDTYHWVLCLSWPRFVAALYAVGYDNVISVEHEDRRFEGDVDLVKRGFLIARNTLRPLIA